MPDDYSDKHNLLNKILLKIIIFLLSVISAGTVFGLLNRKNHTPEVLISQGKAESLMAPADTTEVAYYELGTLRISTAGEKSEENGCIMILSPWLAYLAGDTVFPKKFREKAMQLKESFRLIFLQEQKISCSQKQKNILNQL